MEEKEEIKEKVVKKKGKKKLVIVVISIALLVIAAGIIFYIILNNTEKLPKLPKPQITDGVRGEFGIDRNINESTIDKYLGRSDSVYRDMRMLEDPAKYENIGGDRFLSGYIKGFEVIPLPYIIPVEGLPEEVGDTYYGNTLFREENGKYIANYKESKKILEEIFPKNKVIFLMCGGGGYAGMTKNFLISMGYDENKIYNVGGHWYYKGKNNIKVPKNADGSYNFSDVPYHKIDFSKLKKSKKYKAPKVKVTEIKLNTDKIEIEEGTSFKLNVIVLPNEATNKEVKWTSKDEKISTVDKEGLVKAIKEGSTTITVESIDGKKTVNCEVIVKKKEISKKIKLDNVSKEVAEFLSYDLDKLYEKFSNIIGEMSDDNKYYTKTEDGGYITNELWNEEYEKHQQRLTDAQNKRIEILNKVVDSKKNFVILIHTSECDVREYEVKDGAKRILDQNGYSYFEVGNPTGDETLQKSHLDIDNFNWSSSVVIIKNGSIYASLDPNVDSIKNDAETKNWLNKYIDLK